MHLRKRRRAQALDSTRCHDSSSLPFVDCMLIRRNQRIWNSSLSPKCPNPLRRCTLPSSSFKHSLCWHYCCIWFRFPPCDSNSDFDPDCIQLLHFNDQLFESIYYCVKCNHTEIQKAACIDFPLFFLFFFIGECLDMISDLIPLPPSILQDLSVYITQSQGYVKSRLLCMHALFFDHLY